MILLKKFFINFIIVSLTIVLLIFITELISNCINRDECNHKYINSNSSVEPTLFTVGYSIEVCQKCHDMINTRKRALIDLPQLYLEGPTKDLSKTSESFMKVQYFEGDKELNCFSTIKYQGHTSLQFEKKNYTIKFYEDQGYTTKLKLSFNGWSETSKFCLKANYIDYSNSRNVVSSNIWRSVVNSNPLIDDNIRNLEFQSGIDGFPIALFLNDEYQGVYTFNIPKDEDTYEIADDENEAMFVINSSYSESAKFKALISEDDRKSIYDLEYSYTDDEDIPFSSMNNLINFVINNDGLSFINGIETYLDINAAIDYLLTTYVLGLTDNFSKNMILITYNGTKWIPIMYDLDTAFGLSFDGTKYLDYDFSIPFINDNGVIESNTDNLLWDRILNNYITLIKERYFNLRQTILKNEEIINKFSSFINSIPNECYEYEKKLYPSIPFHNVNQIQHMSLFLQQRTKLLDEFFEKF